MVNGPERSSGADLFDLDGRVALISGGSRGLGREMALAFAERGADVIVASRRIESCQAVVAEIEALGRRALAHACHVGHWQELDGLVEAAYREFGKVDVLVNNAGMSPLYGDPVEVSEQLFDKVIDVNLKGPFRLTALVGARMAEAGSGSIINISSGASLRPRRDVIAYAAAKAGVNALTVAFADALGPAVRVNTIVPGPFLTDISKAWDMEKMEERFARLPLRRGGEPHEIVGAALYLASDASSYSTATSLVVDGGTTWF